MHKHRANKLSLLTLSLQILERDTLKSRIGTFSTILTRFNWRRCELKVNPQWRQYTNPSHLTSNTQALRRMEVPKRWYTLLPLELMVSHLNYFFAQRLLLHWHSSEDNWPHCRKTVEKGCRTLQLKRCRTNSWIYARERKRRQTGSDWGPRDLSQLQWG